MNKLQGGSRWMRERPSPGEPLTVGDDAVLGDARLAGPVVPIGRGELVAVRA